MNAAVRQPSVAGAFYPGSASQLERAVRELIVEDEVQHELALCVVPHAGYVYSGRVAGKVFGHLTVPRRLIVLGPNHTGMGAPVGVASHDAWQTPLGSVRIDGALREAVLAASTPAASDSSAHLKEHSIEVQLPFLLARQPELEVLPICLSHLRLEECVDLGHALADVVAAAGEPVGIVVSSDMSHYVPDDVARELDRKVIDAALTLEPAALYETVHANRISMCGVIPATVALAAAQRLEVSNAHLVDYATSGDTSGDYSAVVGYAGLCLYR